MKRLFLLPVLITTVLFSCGKKKKVFNGLLQPSNINSQFFTINPGQETTIRTSHASVLKIKKGTFTTDSPVVIEIKEVFTPDEILRSGLTTLSDGKPLRSAGMIYFNATADGSATKPALPIETFIPDRTPDEGMQLFKGEIQADSTVEWKDPQPIADTTSPKDVEMKIANGRALFRSKCGTCHGVFKDGTGPALRGLQYRGPWKDPKNILRFVNIPWQFMATDKYTQDLKAKYGSMMTGFPDLREADIINLLTYIDNTTIEEQLAKPVAAINDTSTFPGYNCGSDTMYFSTTENFEEYDTSGQIVSIDDPEYGSLYNQGYDFEITDNGWYNIDQFLKTETEDVKEVALTADIKTAEEAVFHVYLFMPADRVMQQYTIKKGNLYTFDFGNGYIPLPVGNRAVVFAFASIGKRVLYGVTEFTVRKEQVVTLEIKETTKEGLNNLLNSKNINGVQIDAIEKEMQVMPKPCDEAEAKKDTISIQKQ
jgi:cytochrome c2